MDIIKPEEKYLQSYYEACKETWEHVHDSYILHDPDKFDEWQGTIFQEYENQEKGINLSDGFMPSITYWIIENNEYAGTINLRPVLSNQLREYGGHAGYVIRLKYRNQGLAKKAGEWTLKKLRELNVSEILLTCEETNTPSQKVLNKLLPSICEKDTVMLNNKPTPIRRYYYNV